MKTAVQTFYYKHNRLQQLRGFCFAAQYGSIVRAAEQMGLTHSSVSLQIKALEDDMGCALFTRRGPKIVLTSDGAKLLEMSLPLVDGIQNLHGEFHREIKKKANAELRIAVNGTTKPYLTPAIACDYIEQHPDMRLVLHFAEQAEAMKLLEDGTMDLAFLPRREHMPFPKSCTYVPIFYCKPCLITLPDHPLAGRKNLTVDEIKRYPLTLPAEELRVIPGLHELFGEAIDQSDHLRIAFTNAETGREYIEKGLLITISSDVWLHENDILTGTSLSHLFSDVDYGVVCKTGKVMPKKVRDFIEIARRHALKRMGWK